LLEFLETVPIDSDRNQEDFRFAVQYVQRPNLDYRGFAGEVAAGVVKKGDQIMVLPSRKTSKVASIDTYDGPLLSAGPSRAITLRLENEIDISRGDMLVHPDNVPEVARRFDANLVWLSERELDANKSYLLKHTTRVVRANVESVLSVMDLNALEQKAASSLRLNDIGRVRIQCHAELYFDAYTKSRNTGAFILIDSLTNNTVAAGMIVERAGAATDAVAAQAASSAQGQQVSSKERQERLGQSGAVAWLQGTRASELANAVERVSFDRGHVAAVVDPSLGAARELSAATALAEVSVRMAEAGLWVLVSAAADAATIARVSERLGKERCLTVNLSDSLEIQGEKFPALGQDLEKAAGKVTDALQAPRAN
jgi:bifunctional enzyme CysN/CysC